MKWLYFFALIWIGLRANQRHPIYVFPPCGVWRCWYLGHLYGDWMCIRCKRHGDAHDPWWVGTFWEQGL